jgi:hypothetical protein
MRKSVFDLHKPELERLGRGILEQIAKDKGWDKEIERSGGCRPKKNTRK